MNSRHRRGSVVTATLPAYCSSYSERSAQADTGKFMSAHLLLDWDQSKAKGPNALTDKGKPVAYSPELALAILSADDDLGIGDEYRGAVAYAAGKASERLLEKTRAASGN